MPKTRARAASLAGTSSTRSPAAISRWASGRPITFAPSTAHTRSGQLAQEGDVANWFCYVASHATEPFAQAVRGIGEDRAMTTYSGAKEFEGATFVKTSFKGAALRFCDVSGVTMRGVDVDGLDIDSHDLFFGSLFVNGVDVVPLVDAELNRQFPGRELQKAQTPEGLRDGWVAVQSAWRETVAGTPPDLVDAHVEDEWSLAQTLRHLILATDAWLRGGIWRMQQPFHQIGQIFTGAAEMGFDMSIFRVDAPAYEEILAVRAERQQLVTDFLATATPELLAEERDNPWGGGDWHPTVGDCIRVILEEEWAHLRYIRRDLARMR